MLHSHQPHWGKPKLCNPDSQTKQYLAKYSHSNQYSSRPYLWKIHPERAYNDTATKKKNKSGTCQMGV